MTSTPDDPRRDLALEGDLDLLEQRLEREARAALERPAVPRSAEERAMLLDLERGFERTRERWVEGAPRLADSRRGPTTRRMLLIAALLIGLAGLAWKFWPRSGEPVVVVDPGHVRGGVNELALSVAPGPALDGSAYDTLHFVWTTPPAVRADARYTLTIREREALLPQLEFDALRGETLSLTRGERAQLEAGREYVAELEMFVGPGPDAALSGRVDFRVD